MLLAVIFGQSSREVLVVAFIIALMRCSTKLTFDGDGDALLAQAYGGSNTLGQGVSAQLEDSAKHRQKKQRLSNARTLKPGDFDYVSIDNVRGSKSLRAELRELVDLLRHPEKYQPLGVTPPRGVLFTGEPGTGKTFAARAVASAAGLPFLSTSGADLRSSSYVGQGSDLTIQLFQSAKQRAPCVVFIDEIDSVGRKRRSGDLTVLDMGLPGESTSADAENNVNAMLALMEELPPGVLVLGATNRPEVLDEALLRTGRFGDRRIEFKLPDEESREDILRHEAGSLPLAEGSQAPDFPALAKETASFSPADLHAVLREAALHAARRQATARVEAQSAAAPAATKSAPSGEEAAATEGTKGVRAAAGGAEESEPEADESSITDEDVRDAIGRIVATKAKARPLGNFQVTQRPAARLSSLQGCDDAVGELRDLVDFLADPMRFKRLGASLPRGFLLAGPPGTGKTLAARAVAGQAGVPFLSVAGSEFQTSLAGQGGAMVQELFAQARRLAPCIVFVDEVDALGRERSSGAMGAQQDRESTLMQLLVEMDGFEEGEDGVFVLAATNRPELLDAALLRPGRFDRRIEMALPELAGRQAILNFHARGKVFAEDVDLADVAKHARGFSGAELKNVLNEAALRAGRRCAETIEQQDVVQALKKARRPDTVFGFAEVAARTAAADAAEDLKDQGF